MKKTIDWYEETGIQRKRYYDKMKEDALVQLAVAEAGLSDYAFLLEQIEEAKRRGLDAFDADKLLRKMGAR